VILQRASPAVLTHDVILQSKNWMKKSQNMLVWLRKMVLAQHYCTVCGVTGKRHSNALCTCRKECNEYDLETLKMLPSAEYQ
jgi:hypothetical protein